MKKPLSYIEISKENLLHNIATFRSILGDQKKLVAVVKANAYGHGMKEVAEKNRENYEQLQVSQRLYWAMSKKVI